MSQLSKEQISVWADHINAQRNSGLSQQAYCELHALKPHQYWYWKRKLDGEEKKPRQYKKAKPSGFVSVKIAEPRNASSLSITLPNGIILSGVDLQNLSLAQQLIGTLK
jgi:hypothetical protein